MHIKIITIYWIGLIVAPIAFVLINRYARLISKSELNNELKGDDAGGIIFMFLLMWVAWPISYGVMGIYYLWLLFKFLAFTDDPK